MSNIFLFVHKAAGENVKLGAFTSLDLINARILIFSTL